MNSQKKFNIITAINNESEIGVKEYGEHSLPWPMIKEDMNFFFSTTSNTPSPDLVNAIIVGYNTWTTLPPNYRKNTNRITIVISRELMPMESGMTHCKEIFVKTFDEALNYASDITNLNEIFVIGGAVIYDAALAHPMLDRIYLTHIQNSYPKKTNAVEHIVHFPISNMHFDQFVDQQVLNLEYESEQKLDVGKNIYYRFKTYKVCSPNFTDMYRKIKKNDRIEYLGFDALFIEDSNKNLEEYQYLNLVRTIIEKGTLKQTRNAVTKSIFGYQLRYDLSLGYPLATVKKSFPKSIFEELMWMIRGQTDVKKLREKGVNIWNKNSTKEFLEKYGLPYEQDDIGCGYGFQLRHFGAEYTNCKTDYAGKGTDQLQLCIDLINKDPHSRRIIIDLWNATDIDKMALAPCHLIYNFGVDLYNEPNESGRRGKLNCHLFQRSWDVLLGWNTTTAALLTYLLAHHCDLDPGILVHSISDAHLYSTHIESGAVEKLLSRIPRNPPTLKIINKKNNIEDYEFSDLVIENYYPCPPIIAEMIA